MLAVYNQECSNRSNLVPTFLGEVGTPMAVGASMFQRFVPTVPTSLRDTRTHARARTCVRVCMDGTCGTHELNNHKTMTYCVPTSCFGGWNRLERLEHIFFSHSGGLCMADEVDRANDVVQRHLDAVIQAHQASHARADDCFECGELISAARQKATGGTELCFECASMAELKGRVYR